MKNPEDLKKPIAIFNPLPYDFSYTWFDDKNAPHLLTIKSIDMEYFPPYQAHFMAKHLVDALMNKYGYDKNPEEQRKKLLQDVYVKV